MRTLPLGVSSASSETGLGAMGCRKAASCAEGEIPRVLEQLGVIEVEKAEGVLVR